MMSQQLHSIVRNSSTDRETIIDSETGEVLESRLNENLYVANSKEEFFIMYSKLLGIIENMTLPEIKVFAYILRNYLSTEEFQIGMPIKKKISELYGIKIGTIDNTLTSLKKKKLVYSPSTGLYMINPRYVFKGSTTNRNFALTAIFKLGCKDC